MIRKILLTGSLFAALAVVLGAFGAHALKGQLDDYAKGIYSTANDYHFYHSLGLILLGVIAHQRPDLRFFGASAVLMSIGIILFSGSLYLLAVSGIRWLGAITPLGGVAFILSWLLLAYCIFRNE